ncbi:MAG: hypothetical protein ACR2GO_09505 [Candidatus Limnocylindria bacterium]
MLHHIRPLVASRFRIATDLPVPGRYDSERQLRLDEGGWPVAATGPIGETFTEVRSESPDPSEPPLWLFETFTKVVREDPDDFRALTDTDSRTRSDPGDPGVLPPVIMSADDSVTGIVAF